MEAQPHPRQAERLEALYSYEILDTDPDEEFDDVTRLAGAVCQTPIAVINLIDAERQWFKSEIGLGVRETPLATSICSHVILESEFVEIADTLTDPRMADNPLCCGEPGLRFYAGALLKSDNGMPIGTLCVLDWQPRTLTPLQRDAIRVLANQVMAQLNLRRSLKLAGLLRQEVDHRVKNSLQTLSSLARMQTAAAESPDTKAALETMRRRIQAVSSVHDQLYRAQSGNRVDLVQYIENIAWYLRSIGPSHVTIETAIETASVSSSQAMAIGILISELASNSFKHAFPDDRTGTIHLAIVAAPQGMLALDYRDDGIGLTAAPDEVRNGLGMKIVDALSRQLGAQAEMPQGEGYRIRLASIVAEPR